MTRKNWRFWTYSTIFSPSIISPVMIKDAIIFPSKVTDSLHGRAQGEAMQAVVSPSLKFEPRIFLKFALYSSKKLLEIIS